MTEALTGDYAVKPSSNDTNGWQEYLSGVHHLLPLPGIALPLLRACNNPATSLEQIHALLRYDASMVARILDMQAHHADNPQREIQQTIAEVDRDTIKRLLLTSLGERPQQWQIYNAELNRFRKDQWVHSLQMAFLARAFALEIGYQKPNQAYFAALLHNIGQLLLQAADNDEYLALWQRNPDEQSLLLAEQRLYGAHHADISATLLKSWHVEYSIQDAARYHHDNVEALHNAHPLTRLVYLAHAISWRRFDNFKDVTLLIRRLLTIKVDHVAPLVESAFAQAGEVIRLLEISIPRGIMRQRLVPILDQEPDQDDSQDAFKTSQLTHEVTMTGLLDGVRASLSECLTERDIQQHAEQAAYALFNARQLLFFRKLPGDVALTGHCLLRTHACVNEMRITTQALPTSPTSAMMQSLLVQAINTNTMTHTFQTEPQSLCVADQEILHQIAGVGFLCVPQAYASGASGVLVFAFDDEASMQLATRAKSLHAFAKAIDDRLQIMQHQQRQCDEIRLTEHGLHLNRLKRLIHEVNNPLSIAQNHLHVLTLQVQDQADCRERCQIVEEEITRGADLLKQHAEQMDQEDQAESAVQINELISDCMLVFQTAFLDDRQIEPELELDPLLPTIYLDVGAVKQILSNLIRNAAESLEQGGWLCVRTLDQVIIDGQAYIEIQVIDDGPGVPKELLGQLFSPLRSTKSIANAGIGLSIVKELVNQLGGSISYRRSPDQQSVFSVFIPRHCSPDNRGTTAQRH